MNTAIRIFATEAGLALSIRVLQIKQMNKLHYTNTRL